MLTAEERAQTERKTLDDDDCHFMRTIIDGFRLSYADESMWVDRLEMALDSADHWRKRAEAAEANRGGDPELLYELNCIEAACMNAGIDRKNLTVFVMVSKLSDAYRSEKERADRLQRKLESICSFVGVRDANELHVTERWCDIKVAGSPEYFRAVESLAKDRNRLQRENETLRAARESLEPVGWTWRSRDGFWWLRTEYAESALPLVIGDITDAGTKRRVYLAPPQPLEESC